MVSERTANEDGVVAARADGLREGLAFCLRRRHLRRTATIALCVGTLLTLINHADVIVAGDATALTAIKVAANFVIPFIVSNLGLLGARPAAVDLIKDEVEGSRRGP